MKHGRHHEGRHRHDELNRGDYRRDFGRVGRNQFASPAVRRDEHHEPHETRHPYRDDRDRRPYADDRGGREAAGPWNWEYRGREGWQRGRVSGGYGSQFDSWRSGLGFPVAGFGFGPAEEPGRGGFEDEDWQPTRPARGRGAWAGDWSEENYRGRGPRDYRRSDERIRDEVCERLTDDWSVDATDIVVQVENGEVTLSGHVLSRDQKRRAGECAEGVRGVQDVFNQLRVAGTTDLERRSRRVDVR